MDASQYKDYLLTLLFMKYVSDKYASDPALYADQPARISALWRSDQAVARIASDCPGEAERQTAMPPPTERCCELTIGNPS